LSVQSTLEDKIRKTQGFDKDLMKIRMHTGKNKAPDFRVDEKEPYGTKIEFAYPRKETSGRLLWMRPTTRHIPST
jgi:hypothetical protein